MNGEFAVTNNIMTTIDFIHLDHAQSEPKRRLIAYDPAHAPKAGNYHCLSVHLAHEIFSEKISVLINQISAP